MTAPRRARESGATLIEALIAMVVLTVGLLGLFVLHQTALRSNAQAYRYNVATLLAQDALEYLSTRDFGSDPSTQDVQLVPDGSSDPTTATDPLATLPRTLSSDAGYGGLINSMGADDPSYGTPIYTRSYMTEYVDASDPSRVLIRVRVTFENPVNGQRQGVTLAQTRSYDSYRN